MDVFIYGRFPQGLGKGFSTWLVCYAMLCYGTCCDGFSEAGFNYMGASRSGLRLGFEVVEELGGGLSRLECAKNARIRFLLF